ncbi:dihydropteroate synthase [Azonexus fungiphilus]|uniref:dihydropteroate synthase n=1 Tax=Azonexus fungiphilus TaxID=146940 RepID=UPI00156BADED|nr:dihydropteroate synthase [Azonexus fungiphilus]NHC06122.1 dihydropteroate synthase [Azonexus fungiphilus]
MQSIQCGKFRLSTERPLVMGIVNLTPDSFSGDGRGGDIVAAIAHARRQLAAGADILDIGAESTRPGAQPTPEDEELRRLMPVLAEITTWGVPVSVDTYKPAVMRAALAAGASMINDIAGLASAESLAAVADSDCGLCLMHMQGQPRDMQQAPVYGDVVGEVAGWLAAAVERCQAAGIARERIVLDPGFGFGKTLAHNLALFRGLTAKVWSELPLLVGVSRKTMLGQITGRPVEARQAASVAAALLAAQRGAAILRVHDVAETRDALAVWAAIEDGK